MIMAKGAKLASTPSAHAQLFFSLEASKYPKIQGLEISKYPEIPGLEALCTATLYSRLAPLIMAKSKTKLLSTMMSIGFRPNCNQTADR